MSNLILGVIGVVLFIGMALGGASFFGPRLTESTSKTQSVAVMQANATIAYAVETRDRELQATTQTNGNLALLLTPYYLPEMPANPLGGIAPMVLDRAGKQLGDAAFVAIKLNGLDAGAICGFIHREGGGENPVPVMSGPTNSRPVGCFKASVNLTSQIRQGDFLAYATIGG